MSTFASRPVVVTVERGDRTTLTSDLAELVGARGADVSFASFEGSPGANRSAADFATSIATLAPTISAVGTLLLSVVQFATSRGSRTIEITGADGNGFKIPTSVSASELGGYVEQFQQVSGVRIHVDLPAADSAVPGSS